MSMVSVEQLRVRLSQMEERRAYFERKSTQPPTRLTRHEVWRHSYLSYPYLIGAPDDRIALRFRDIFINQTELGHSGKIGMRPFQTDDSFLQSFTHMLEEYGSRGGSPPSNVIMDARKPLFRYFQNGDPIAIRMFSGYNVPPSPILVKYGRRQFLDPMLNAGEIRICPASFYNNSGFLESARDDETSRYLFIPTFRERLAGKHHFDFQGHRISFGHDDIMLPVIVPDYYLFSLCDHVYYRMPTDFDADAALIIRDPARFIRQVISAFLARSPEWHVFHGPVTYYDPYRDHTNHDFTKFKVPEMVKHFAYAYQREVRIALRAKRSIRSALEPIHISIGAMTEYAELLYA